MGLFWPVLQMLSKISLMDDFFIRKRVRENFKIRAALNAWRCVCATLENATQRGCLIEKFALTCEADPGEVYG